LFLESAFNDLNGAQRLNYLNGWNAKPAMSEYSPFFTGAEGNLQWMSEISLRVCW
jgi:hypothetical protein